MCGRARCTLAADEVGAACGRGGPLRTIDPSRYHPSYNVSPGAWLPILRYDGEGDAREPVVHSMKWGLVPSFTKKTDKVDHYRMFNARSESVHQKSSFSRLLPKKRCVLCVEGFYEWQKDHGQKQPYYIHFQNQQPLAFACLYDSWQNADGETLFTFTILTTHVSKRLEWLHDRMPVILGSQEALSTWLGDESMPESETFRKLVQPYEAAELVWYPVTTAMGKPTFNSPECVKEIKPQSTQSITSFFKRKPAEQKATESEKKAKTT